MRDDDKTGDFPAATRQLGRDLHFPFEVADQSQASFLAKVSAAVGPKDFIEDHWVGVAARLMWEYIRVSRLKNRVLAHARSEGIAHLAARFGVSDDAGPGVLVSASADAGNNLVPKDAAFDEADVDAQVLLVSFEENDRIEHYLNMIDDRLQRTLLNIERRRAALAKNLREVSRANHLPPTSGSDA